MNQVFMSIAGYISLSEIDSIVTTTSPQMVSSVPTEQEFQNSASSLIAQAGLMPDMPALVCYRAYSAPTEAFSLEAQYVYVPQL